MLETYPKLSQRLKGLFVLFFCIILMQVKTCVITVEVLDAVYMLLVHGK